MSSPRRGGVERRPRRSPPPAGTGSRSGRRCWRCAASRRRNGTASAARRSADRSREPTACRNMSSALMPRPERGGAVAVVEEEPVVGRPEDVADRRAERLVADAVDLEVDLVLPLELDLLVVDHAGQQHRAVQVEQRLAVQSAQALPRPVFAFGATVSSSSAGDSSGRVVDLHPEPAHGIGEPGSGWSGSGSPGAQLRPGRPGRSGRPALMVHYTRHV